MELYVFFCANSNLSCKLWIRRHWKFSRWSLHRSLNILSSASASGKGRLHSLLKFILYTLQSFWCFVAYALWSVVFTYVAVMSDIVISRQEIPRIAQNLWLSIDRSDASKYSFDLVNLNSPNCSLSNICARMPSLSLFLSWNYDTLFIWLLLCPE